jgi:putative sugar O-methyltransferase
MAVFWDKRVKSLSNSFLANKQTFLSNQDVSRVMQTHNTKMIDSIVNFINDDSIIEKVKDPAFGNPSTHRGVSLQSVRNVAYRMIMNSFFDISQINHVTDFGGGFGNNCRIWYTLGYEGDFSLIDLPEVVDIQRHYLSNVLPNQKINYISDINNLQINKSKSLFFATYSLSETSLEVREKAFSHIANHDYIFIAHNDSFPVYENKRIDNNEYFANMKHKLSDQFKFFDFDKKIYKNNARYVIGMKL